MKWLDGMLKSIPDSVLNVIGLLSGIITIVNVVPILIKAIRLLLSGNFSFSQITSLRALFIFLLMFCTWLLFKTVKYRKVQAETREIFSQGYYNLLRNYRNVIGDIQVAQKRSEDSLLIIRVFIVQALDVLCDILFKLTRQKVSSCVKIIEPAEDLDYLNASVYTFCRSSNSDPQRTVYDDECRKRKILICDNTDFNKIVEPAKSVSCFYAPDLIAYKKGLRKIGDDYDNTNSHWEKFYKSTIVVPIRIANQRNPNNELENSYTILGFLCVDSKSTHAFEESQKSFYKPIVKAFAALLYSVLELYKLQVDSSSSVK